MSSARRREAEHILKLCLGDHLRAYQIVERQLGVLSLRAQVMLPFVAVVVLATGFSARAVAQSSNLVLGCLAAGLLMTLLAAAEAIRGVLQLRWPSQEIDDEPVVTLLRGLEIRDRKSRSLRRAVSLFVLGWALDCLAIGQILWAAR